MSMGKWKISLWRRASSRAGGLRAEVGSRASMAMCTGGESGGMYVDLVCARQLPDENLRDVVLPERELEREEERELAVLTC